MAKILLVEDDNNLREIYEARLQAEGYTIVSAMDGEAALVVAKKEKPELIISDVMMPRISGFEMLDILRNTEGLKDVKVIMLTALGQAEDKTRADSLGANRYLVKSQVTLEDIVKAAQELLAPEGNTPASTPATTAEVSTTGPTPVPAAALAPAIPVAAPPQPTPVNQPAAQPTAPAAASIPVVPQPAPAGPKPAEEPPTGVPAPTNPPVPPAVTPPAPTLPAIPTNNSPPPIAAPAPAEPPLVPATPVAAPSANPILPTPAQPTAPLIAPAPTSTGQPVVALPAPAVKPAQPVAAATLPAAPAASADDIMADAIKNLVSETEAAGDKPPASPKEPVVEPISEPVATPAEPAVVAAPIIAPVTPVPAPSADTGTAQSTSDEEAAIAAQIEKFVSQTPTPETAGPAKDTTPAPVAPAPPPEESAPAPAVTPVTAPAAEPAPNIGVPGDRDDDGVAIAHKKVIKPISSASAAPPNLNELLAKEGFSSDFTKDDESVATTPPPPPVVTPAATSPAASAPQATTGSLPTTPHPPGHVISPNGSGGSVDPSSIAL
jgi:CheY-like chemotaxis protein